MEFNPLVSLLWLVWTTLFIISTEISETLGQGCSTAIGYRERCGGIRENDRRSCLQNTLCCYDPNNRPHCYIKKDPILTILKLLRLDPSEVTVAQPNILEGMPKNVMLSKDQVLQTKLESFWFDLSRNMKNLLFPTCAVNVPICRRTQCGVAGSNDDPNVCLSDPKCCFDKDFFLHRKMYGNGFMNGAPTCYEGATSSGYNQIAKLLDPWNPYYQTGVASLFNDTEDIPSQSLLSLVNLNQKTVCLITNILDFDDKSGRRICGWEGISRQECLLRDCCFNILDQNCYYPTDNLDKDLGFTLSKHPELRARSFKESVCPKNQIATTDLDVYSRLPCSLDATTCSSKCCKDKNRRNTIMHFFESDIMPRARNDDVIAEHQTLPPYCPFYYERKEGMPDLSKKLKQCCEVYTCYHTKEATPQTVNENDLKAGQQYPPILNEDPSVKESKSLEVKLSWTDWEPWSACSKSCDIGIKTKKRTCVLLGRLEEGCEGDSFEATTCSLQKCPEPEPTSWGAWSNWNNCSASCGGSGLSHRYRDCISIIGRVVSPSNCSGVSEESRTCNTKSCGTWSDWGEYICNATCLSTTGWAVRKRICLVAGNISNSCAGKREERIPCFAEDCPEVGQWQPWGKCSEQCGGGVTRRRRLCFKRGSNIQSSECLLNTMEEKTCNADPCEEKAVRWGEWSSWNSCSKSCDEGFKERIRTCIKNGAITNERLCQLLADESGKAIERQMCQLTSCDSLPSASPCMEETCAQWTQWSVVRPCIPEECSKGTQTKVRCKAINKLCIARTVQYSEASCPRNSDCN